VIQIYEIYKFMRRDMNEEHAIEAVSALHRSIIEALVDSLHSKPRTSLSSMASPWPTRIFATVSRHDAEIVTGDVDGLPSVTRIR
jgi:hypothetical protein